MKVIDVFQRAIREYNMLRSGDRVVVGVSGGPDSITLLHLLYKFRDYYDIDILAAHLNHNFRPGDAEKDAEYVERFCRRIGIPCIVEFCDVPAMAKRENLSPEQAGRKARYDLFYRVMRERGYNKIAVAHNRDDQVETVLMRFIRGSGVEGLGGIHPVRGCIIRPLLDVPRSAIEEYCKEHKLEPVTDYSNFKPVYTRNKLRLEFIPYIRREYNPNIDRVIADTAQILRQENEYIHEVTERRFRELIRKKEENRLVFDIEGLKSLHGALLRRVLRMGVEKLKGDITDIAHSHIESLFNLVQSGETGRIIDLPGSLIGGISYGEFFLSAGKQDAESIDKVYSLKIPGTTVIGEINGVIEAEIITVSDYLRDKENIDGTFAFFDYEKTGDKLFITKREYGDRFKPLGMKGTKKLKDFLIDLKVPKDKRDAIPIVRNQKGIVWVAGYRMDEDYKIDFNTRKVLKLRYHKRFAEEE
jgi:tRNA(Ile)-lysidine synthase